jgi:hypothetical protein
MTLRILYQLKDKLCCNFLWSICAEEGPNWNPRITSTARGRVKPIHWRNGERHWQKGHGTEFNNCRTNSLPHRHCSPKSLRKVTLYPRHRLTISTIETESTNQISDLAISYLILKGKVKQQIRSALRMLWRSWHYFTRLSGCREKLSESLICMMRFSIRLCSLSIFRRPADGGHDVLPMRSFLIWFCDRRNHASSPQLFTLFQKVSQW